MFENIVTGVLGLRDESTQSGNNKIINGVIEMVLEMRREAKASKDYAKSDQIRDKLTELGITIKDTKEGSEWSI